MVGNTTKIRSYTMFLVDQAYGVNNRLPFRPSAYYRNISYGTTHHDARNLSADSITSYRPSMMVDLDNALVKRFQNKLGDHSSFGATLTAELNSTVGTVAGIVLRAVKAARQIRKLDFAGAASTLGIPYRERTITKTRFRKRLKPLQKGESVTGGAVISRRRVFTLPTGREVTKTLANGWLLYSYGIKPLVGDIYNAIETITRPLEYKELVTASATISKPESEMTTEIYRGDLYYYSRQLECTLKGKTGAFVTVGNPNFRILSQMGLTNPAQWVIEAIPFSFVVDWFSNLSEVIGSFSAYEGLVIEDPWTSYKHIFNLKFVVINPYENYVSNPSGMTLTRNLRLPEVKLVFKYERFEPQRALNAISLLLGILPKK